MTTRGDIVQGGPVERLDLVFVLKDIDPPLGFHVRWESSEEASAIDSPSETETDF